MKKTATTLLATAAAFMTGMFATAGAQAQEKFPSRPIVIVVPYTAGGPTDVHVRFLMSKLEKDLGVPFVLDNKPGATATLGPATVAAMKPDGYTLTHIPAGVFSVPQVQKVSFDPAKDFTYIIGLSGYRLTALVRPNAPWKTFNDLVAAVKAKPESVVYGSTGPVGVVHLMAEQVSAAKGMKMRMVPFRGTSEAVAAFLGEHIDITIVAGNFLNLIEAGQARPIFYFSKEESKRNPGTPNLTSEGIEPAIDLAFPYGMGGPKGMKPEIVKILHDAVKRAVDTPEHAKVLEDLDQSLTYMNPEDYRAFALKQIEAYKVVLPQMGYTKKD